MQRPKLTPTEPKKSIDDGPQMAESPDNIVASTPLEIPPILPEESRGPLESIFSKITGATSMFSRILDAIKDPRSSVPALVVALFGYLGDLGVDIPSWSDEAAMGILTILLLCFAKSPKKADEPTL